MSRALGEGNYGIVEVAPKNRQVFVKTVPPTVGRKDLEKVSRNFHGGNASLIMI